MLPRSKSDWRRLRLRARHRRAEIVFEGPCRIGPGFAVLAPGPFTLVIGAGVDLRKDVYFELNHHATLRIGAHTVMNRGVTIQVTKAVTIGEGTLLAANTHVVDSKHRFREADEGSGLIEFGLDYEPLHIGAYVWIAGGAVIGADIGDHAVIGANAVVNRPIEPWTFAGGIPAKPIERYGPARDCVNDRA